jgi:glycosyltransferase involved in cell wall biosynthesis
MNEMKRILLVAPVRSHPSTTGASARIGQMAESLSRMGHEVHFLYLQQPVWGAERQMRRYWGERYHVFRGLTPASCVARARRKVVRIAAKTLHRNLPVDSYFDRRSGGYVRSRIAGLAFDVVIVSYVFYSKILESFPDSALKILDTHDVFSERYRLYKDQGLRAEFFSTTRTEERKALERADLVLAIQDWDAAHFRSLTDTPVAVVGHLEPPGETGETPAAMPEPGILFVGGPMAINAHGVTWFTREVLPRVRSQVPAAELWLAGGICSHFRRRIPGVRPLGFVEPITDLYQRAGVVINPQQFGTGLSIKCIEALAHGRPLVTTVSGARGLEDGEPHAFLAARSPEEFADLIVLLLQDRARAAALGRDAAAFARRYHQKHLQALTDAVNVAKPR